jgi:epoxyqueuosine reductase
MTSRAHATSAIKAAALELGFDAVGIAEAVPLIDPIARYQEWLSRGYHGMMGYLERNVPQRQDVSAILPGAKSVIVVARNYYTPHTHQHDGKLSRYSWGDDYHDVLPPMLDELCERIRTIVPGSETRRYTDTGPVMEKEWAVRAGLGWQGKHSNIIRRDIGSWFFLAVIITTAELDYDAPIEDYCGTCTACLDACPTQAIVEPQVVDATKCLSYWTIEVKPEHELPAEIVNGLDGWLYGCDTCQDVCPWNRFETPTTEPRFEPREGVTEIPPDVIVDLQPDRFAERFRKSPIKRAKLAGLQRTARGLLRSSTPDQEGTS